MRDGRATSRRPYPPAKLRTVRTFCLFLVSALLVPHGVVRGQGDSVPPAAVSRVDVARLGIVFGLGGLAYAADNAARDVARGSGAQGSQALGALADVGNAFGQPGVLGLGALLWGTGLVTDRPAVAASGLRALEAIFVSGVVTQALKEVTGRARPAVAPHSRSDWQLLRGTRTGGGNYQSFISGHTSAAFAFATAVTGEVALRAPEHARWVGLATYGLAATTAYARLHGDRHWLSDVTVAAGVGTVTAWAITRWHVTRPENGIDRWLLRPTIAPAPDGSVRVGFSLQPQ